jgi:putative protease
VTELLSPAGSYLSLVAAVNAGADAVYLGVGGFNARLAAKGFTEEELQNGLSLCRRKGVKIYVTLNTMVYDREIRRVEASIEKAGELADALIVSDLAVAAMARRIVPHIPLHASTQMGVHSVHGARLLHEEGFRRIVLGREMTYSEIRKVVKSVPIETEVFVHGSMCVSLSGGCLSSAFMGGRSGNRGSCAAPCRLPYTIGSRTSDHLSLKDLCLIDRLKELIDIGVTSFKIEGRLRSAEYVGETTEMYRQVIGNSE